MAGHSGVVGGLPVDPFLNGFLTSRQFSELYFPYLCTQISQNKRFLLAHTMSFFRRNLQNISTILCQKWIVIFSVCAAEVSTGLSFFK